MNYYNNKVKCQTNNQKNCKDPKNFNNLKNYNNLKNNKAQIKISNKVKY